MEVDDNSILTQMTMELAALKHADDYDSNTNSTKWLVHQCRPAEELSTRVLQRDPGSEGSTLTDFTTWLDRVLPEDLLATHCQQNRLLLFYQILRHDTHVRQQLSSKNPILDTCLHGEARDHGEGDATVPSRSSPCHPEQSRKKLGISPGGQVEKFHTLILVVRCHPRRLQLQWNPNQSHEVLLPGLTIGSKSPIPWH